jgi:hypothetical protein
MLELWCLDFGDSRAGITRPRLGLAFAMMTNDRYTDIAVSPAATNFIPRWATPSTFLSTTPPSLSDYLRIQVLIVCGLSSGPCSGQAHDTRGVSCLRSGDGPHIIRLSGMTLRTGNHC